MDKSTESIWRDTFANWPPQFRRKAVLVPNFGEPIAFVDFVMTSDVLVIERATPDNVGARRIAIPFQNIEALKYTESLKTEQFLQSGYVKGNNAPAPRAIKKVPIQPSNQGIAGPALPTDVPQPQALPPAPAGPAG